jgi:hypothetical protein
VNPALQTRLAEIEKLLTFVTVEWPGRRAELADQLAVRCQRCILSERYTSIREGLCDVCRSEEAGSLSTPPQPAESSNMERELAKILNTYQGSGTGMYDALVLFSGGKDSAMLLHRLRAEFPELRLLALTVDNGFFSQVAMANCRHILDRIPGVDHTVFKPQASLYVKTFRHAFTHLNEGGCYATVDRMDGDLTFDIGRNLAAAQEIPLMIAGLSPNQASIILGLQSFETLREHEQQRRTHCAGFALDQLYDQHERHKYWWDGTAWPVERIPRVLYPFVAWRYDEDSLRSEVVRLDLIPQGRDNHPLATNNDTIPVMLAVDYGVLGYSSFEPEFAELVRRGKADRDFWLFFFQSIDYLSRRGEFMPASIAETLGKLNLTHSELNIPVPSGG